MKGVNGADIKIKVAPFKDAMRLKNAVMQEVAKAGISIKDVNLKSELSDDFVNSVLKPICYIDSSDNFYHAAFKCMSKCLYNGEKIIEETFEDPEAREDYYLILLEVLKVNMLPFFKGLVTGFKQLMSSEAVSLLQK